MNSNPVEPPSGSDGGSGPDGNEGLALPPGTQVVVPDDPRDLARDVEAWRREERWRRRRERLDRVLRLDRWQHRAVAGPLIALVLVAVTLLGATISLLGPREARPPTAPVALKLAAPAAAPGTAGGLLPDAVLQAQTGTTTARDLRPGIVAIVGPSCDCRRALDLLSHEAAANALSVYLVGTQAQAETVDRLAAQTSSSDVHPLIDRAGGLVAAYRPSGLTVIPVHADGVTAAAIRDYTGDKPLGAVLVSLEQAGPE